MDTNNNLENKYMNTNMTTKDEREDIAELKKSVESLYSKLKEQEKNIFLLDQERSELIRQNKRLEGSINLENEAKERFKSRIIELEKELLDMTRKSRNTSSSKDPLLDIENNVLLDDKNLSDYVRDLKIGCLTLKKERDELKKRFESLERLLHQGQSVTDLLKHQRVAIFVDVQNLYYSAKYIHQSKLSYQKLLLYLTRGRRLIRAISYVVQKQGSDQEGFLEVLKRSGYEIRIRNLIERSDGSRKGDWDMGIAIDAMSISCKVDVIILVSGDGDFLALVNMLKNRGIRVEVASFAESTSEDLIQACNHYWPLESDLLID